MTGTHQAPSPGWLRAGRRGRHPATYPIPKSTKVVWLRKKDLLSLGPSVSPGLYLRHQQCAN